MVHFSIPIFLFSSQHFPSRVTTANELRASDPIVRIHFSCDNNFEPCFTSSINLLFSLPLDLLSHSSTDIFYPAFLNIQIISFWVIRLISKACNMECPLSYSLLNLSIHITAKESQNLKLSLIPQALPVTTKTRSTLVSLIHDEIKYKALHALFFFCLFVCL